MENNYHDWIRLVNAHQNQYNCFINGNYNLLYKNIFQLLIHFYFMLKINTYIYIYNVKNIIYHIIYI